MPRLTPTPYTLNGWNCLDLPDGRVHVWKQVQSSGTFSSWGNLYELKLMDQVSWPLEFTEAPDVFIGYRPSGYGTINWELQGGNATITPMVYVIRPNKPGETVGIKGTIHAIGYPAV